MTRLAVIVCGLIVATSLGCGGTATEPVATTSEPAPETSAIETLPDLQPVPPLAMTTAEPAASTDEQVRQAFDRWVAAATANDPQAWTDAEQELQSLGASAVPALIPVLEGGEPLAREMAVMFLAQLGPQAEPAAAALTKLLDDESSLVRVNAAGVLTTFADPPEEAAGALVALLSDVDANIRTTAAGCLANVAELSPQAVQRLTISLDDVEPGVRAAAAMTLGRAGVRASSAIAKLQSLNADDDVSVREAAETAIRLVSGNAE